MGSIQHGSSPNLSDPELVERLKATLKDTKVLTPNSDGYKKGIKRWSDINERPAGAVVLPTSAEEISAAVTFARTWSIDLAICGGGHASNGASSSDGGLVVDLSRMRAVTVDPSAMTIKAQGGCLWADVDQAAAEHGLAAVGGTVNHTGVGGLTLGGGYGWLTGQYGLVIDNLLAVQLVLADGSIVTASESENSDLFWAVRGAGQAFGVAAEFTYRAHEQKDPVWAGLMMFPAAQAEVIAETTNRITENQSDNSSLFIGIACPPPTFQPAVLVALFHNGPESEAKTLYGPLLDLQPVLNTTGVVPYAAVNSMMNFAAGHGGYKLVKGATYATPVRPAFFRSLLDDLIAFRTQIPNARALIVLEFFPVNKTCAVPHSATAFANRGNYQNAFVSPQFSRPGHADAGRAWAREIAEKFKEEMKRRKRDGEVNLVVEGVGQYGNYDNLDEKGSLIFGPNYERIKELKRKYDPDNLFRKTHVQV